MVLLGYFFFLQYPGVSYVLRFIEGILFACVTAVSIGAFEQLVSQRRGLWTGIFMSLSAYGKLFGPLLGGFIAQFFFRDAVLLVAVIFFLISLFFLFRLPDTRNPDESIHWPDLFPLIEIGHFLQSSRLGGVGLLGVLTNGKNTLFTMFFPILIVSQLGYSEATLGFLLGLQGVMSSFQFLYGKIADKISEEFGVLLGCCIFSIGFIGFSLVDSIYGFGLLLLIIGIGSGIWNVSAWVLMGNQASKADDEAEIVGTYMSLAKLGMFFASVFGAVLVDAFGIALTLTYMGFSVLLGVFVVYFLFMSVFHKA
jgi:MFS family permease